jgi:uncharacterized protein YdhG (YjbR/CyaY superfamily)
MYNQQKPASIDEYISTFPQDVQEKLQRIRATIREAAPDAEETISYQMPAFRQNGILVYFAAFKNHIGFFPTASGVEKFKEELSTFEGSKGTVRFSLDKPIPYDLISRIVRYRVEENLRKAGAKRKKK